MGSTAGAADLSGGVVDRDGVGVQMARRLPRISVSAARSFLRR